MYKVQEGKYGHSWETLEEYDDLDEATRAVWGLDCLGKLHYRIIDDRNNILLTKTVPYEGISVNLSDPNYEWFQAIMSDYGVSKELLFKAILHWLSVHVTPNGI